jgi:ABC-type phosphate/phosphonate transport system substrate-binding protein
MDTLCGRSSTDGLTPSRRAALVLLACTPGWLRAAGPALRLGLSQTLVTDVNMNDARAALLVWLKRISQEMSLPVEYKPEVFDTSPEILKRIRLGQLDAVAINMIEYRQVADLLDPSEVLIQEDGAKRQYVLLVKADGAVRKLGDLRRGKLILHSSPAMYLAQEWLNVLLWTERLEFRETFFGAITAEIKPAKALLPVFFGQAEACLTSRRAFEAMAELNPQVSRQLRVLATSPEIAATCYMFRKNYKDPNREQWIKALSGLRTSVTGRQLLTLFQADSLVVRGADCLSSALQVLEQSDRARRLGGSRKE